MSETAKKAFKLTAVQEAAQKLLSAPEALYGMLFGGSRSGKTFLHVRNVVLRALKAPNSHHLIVRFRFNHIKASIILGTFPKVMQLAFPGIEYKLDRTDWFVRFQNGSEIWFGGLDEKERTEKILGQEYATIYFNECSQIPWESHNIAITRLAEKVVTLTGGFLIPRAFYDMNPTNKIHWTYRMFVQRIDPDSKKVFEQPEKYVAYQMNPQDNIENLSDNYLATLQGLSTRLQKRFLRGEFADATVNALFPDEVIDTWRHTDGDLPDMVRIVVAVDPSGAGENDNADNDAIGICVAGLGVDGNVYVLEDLTVKAGPATWGRVATQAYERHEADAIIGETNFGGAMVKHVIDTARARTNFRKVTASRGKVIRAEPFSALYEQGKIRHVGYLRELEEELSGFTTAGYTGENSPNRADALIWALAALFPNVLSAAKKAKNTAVKMSGYDPMMSSNSWMSA
jgi:predicted phage terminase large subunit-like protein